MGSISVMHYGLPRLSRLPARRGAIAVEQFYRALRREPPFDVVPLSAHDHAITLTPIASEMSPGMLRQLYWEGLNPYVLALEATSDELKLRQALVERVNRQTAPVWPALMNVDDFQLTRRIAKAHIAQMHVTKDLPPQTKVFLDSQPYLVVDHAAGPVMLRLQVWTTYTAAPVIHSKLDFWIDNVPAAFAVPHFIFLDQYAGLVGSRTDFASALRKQVSYGRALQLALGKSFEQAD